MREYSTKQQFVADVVDQLDLALDQLAVRDRNFDRFAIMLVDNVVELSLYEHARAKDRENNTWRKSEPPTNDPRMVSAALGRAFDAKLKLARKTSLLTQETSDSIQYLHNFRNVVYHQGRRHEGILHSLALFYFKLSCALLRDYKHDYWSSGGSDVISHRAIKYLGAPSIMNGDEAAASAFSRLDEVAAALGDTLVTDLATDMETTINEVDNQIDFLQAEGSPSKSRNEVVVDAQAWPFAFSDDGKAWLMANGGANLNVLEQVEFVAARYPWAVRTDPIAGWKGRCQSLVDEKNAHAALKKYCDFMSQTESLRADIDQADGQLNAYIDQQVDAALEERAFSRE